MNGNKPNSRNPHTGKSKRLNRNRAARYGAALLLLWAAGLAVAQDAPPSRVGTVQGEPWPRHTIDGGSRGADGTRLADVNGDGLPDIATGWEEGGRVRVCLHPGKDKVRKPWPSVTVGTVERPEDAVPVDLDGDGGMDVVSATEGSERTVYVHWAPPVERFKNASAWQTAAIPSSRGRQWMFLVPVQLDGANGPDIVAGGKNEGAGLGWFQAPPNPRRMDNWVWKPLQPVRWVMSIQPIDMDGDDDLDIVYSERKGEDSGVWWLENPGLEQLESQWHRHGLGAFGREAMFLDVQRAGEHADPEFSVATRDGGIIGLKKSPGNGRWQQAEIPMPLDAGTGKAVAAGDVDGDGRRDLVVSCEASEDRHGVFRLVPGDAESWDAVAVSGRVGTKFDLVRLLDLDEDGDLDVLTCEENENLGVIWYENPRL